MRLFLLLLLISSTVCGQNNIVSAQSSSSLQELEEVVLSATRTARQLSSLPLNAQLIAKDEIKSINAIRLTDILAEQTGLITVPDFGGGEGIQMQGLDSQYTLILIDGFPLIGRSAGTLDINRLTVGNIEQIEIIKGASSSLYGNEALGGVINIVTKTAKEGASTQLDWRQASFGTSDVSIQGNYKQKALSAQLFANRYSSQGYQLNNTAVLSTVEPFENITLQAKVNYHFSDKTSVGINTRLYNQHQDLTLSETQKGESETEEWNLGIKLDHRFNKQWNAYFELYSTAFIAEEYLNTPSKTALNYFDQRFVRPELRVHYNNEKNQSIIFGLGTTHESLYRTNFTAKPVFDAPYLYAQFDGKLNDKVNMIIGARFDNHNKYQEQFSPKLALRFRLNERIALKTSIGYGFKAPDFRQLYFDFSNSTIGYTVLGYNAVSTRLPALETSGQIATTLVDLSNFDADLKAESSISFNLGLDFKPSARLSSSINLFRNNIHNLIDTQVVARKTNGQNVFSYFNLDQVFTQGIEFNQFWKWNDHFSLKGGYQLLYAKDKEALKAFQQGNVFARKSAGAPAFRLDKNDYFGLLNRSRHMANLKFTYTNPIKNLNANIRVTYRSRYGLFDNNDNSYLDQFDRFVSGYTLWDFAANKRWNKHLRMGIGIDDLFNFTDPVNISNIPGRIYYGKLTFKL